MILFISDVQGRFDVVNAQIDHAESRLGRAVDAVLVPGDVGLYEPQLSRFFRKRGQRFRRSMFYVEGNHEDFDAFDAHVRRYADVMTHLPRATIHAIDGRKILGMGGVSYMDSSNTPQASLVRPDDIERCLCHPRGSADVVMTHDCPTGIGVTSSPTLRHLGPPGFPGSQPMLDHLRPAIWVFGHHHRWFEASINGTRFYGLPEAWRGYALLDQDGGLECVRHEIHQPRGWWRRLTERRNSKFE